MRNGQVPAQIELANRAPAHPLTGVFPPTRAGGGGGPPADRRVIRPKERNAQKLRPIIKHRVTRPSLSPAGIPGVVVRRAMAPTVDSESSQRRIKHVIKIHAGQKERDALSPNSTKNDNERGT